MSAFLHTHIHIGTLAAAYALLKAPEAERLQVADTVARDLGAANMASMTSRYGEPGCTDPTAYLDLCASEAMTRTAKHAPMGGGHHIWDKVGYNSIVAGQRVLALLKACRSYEYQSCEDPEYMQTEAARIIMELTAALVTFLPGWEESAGWTINE